MFERTAFCRPYSTAPAVWHCPLPNSVPCRGPPSEKPWIDFSETRTSETSQPRPPSPAHLNFRLKSAANHGGQSAGERKTDPIRLAAENCVVQAGPKNPSARTVRPGVANCKSTLGFDPLVPAKRFGGDDAVTRPGLRPWILSDVAAVSGAVTDDFDSRFRFTFARLPFRARGPPLPHQPGRRQFRTRARALPPANSMRPISNDGRTIRFVVVHVSICRFVFSIHSIPPIPPLPNSAWLAALN